MEAITQIQRFVAGMEWSDFERNEMALSAVLYKFVIIGEAARHVPTEITEQYTKIPWNEMRALRNFAAHEYHGIFIEVIWDTIAKDLPPLIPMLRNILDENPSSSA